LREECRLRVFENRVLRRIFGPKRDEVTRECRRLHNEELYAVYGPSNIIRIIKSRRLRWEKHVARMGKRRGAYKVLVGKPEERNHLEDPGVDGRTILKWIFRDAGWDSVDWIDLAQDRDRWLALVRAVMNLRAP
jgi:hypothetical protein